MMEDYFYIWNEPTFSVQTFCNMVKDGKINDSKLMCLSRFTNTECGHIIIDDKIYRMYANCICFDKYDDAINIICCVEYN